MPPETTLDDCTVRPMNFVAHVLTTRPGAPWLLDLFSGAGGAAYGYWLAGFNVLGVDIAPQPRYPFWFVQADALEFARDYGGLFDAIHASPPCQRYSTQTAMSCRANHPDFIAPTRSVLESSNRPFVIENVENARHILHNPIKLCGTGLGLAVRRHRYFELGGFDILLVPPCQHDIAVVYITGSTGSGRDPKGSRKDFGVQEMRDASKLYWMTGNEMDEAIPPAYTRYIGEQLMRYVQKEKE